MNPPPAGPSKLRALNGSTPGVIDVDQPTRILLLPGARLTFASFHPHTASGQKAAPDLSKLSLNEELYRPKRIVVETHPDGSSSWRFVPKAKWAHGVQDEGVWPRVIDLCGESLYCSQDQWDIYKLDPAYDCFIPLAPRNPFITHAGTLDVNTFLGQPTATPANPVPLRPPGKQTRPLSPPSPSSRSPSPSVQNKKARTNRATSKTETDDSDSDSLSESDEEADGFGKMNVDSGADAQPTRHRSHSVEPRRRAKRMRQKMEEDRKARREKIVRSGTQRTNGEYFGMKQEAPVFNRKDVPTPAPATGKRKEASEFSAQPTGPHTIHQTVEEDYASKRMRSVSPTSVRRDLHAKRDARLSQRNKRFKPASYMNDILNGIVEEAQEAAAANDPRTNSFQPALNQSQTGTHGFHSSVHSSSFGLPTEEQNAEAVRIAAIEESRRKLAALERDRPLWEEAAQRRAASEQAEELAARERADLKRRAADEVAAREKRDREREDQAAQQRAEVEKEKRRKAEAAAREERRRVDEAKRKQDEERTQQEARRRQQEQRRRTDRLGPWTVTRALDCFKETCDTFDATKFGPESPLTFDAVPWPVLTAPARRSVEDIDWSAVEAFFEAVKPTVRAQEYRQLVEKTQRRFHPDRWRSRRLLQSIENIEERDAIEVAANTVAQAITPIWRALPR